MTNDGKYYFLEDIDYLATSKGSIWGEGDQETLEILKSYDFSGKWLNLSAGDGRYNGLILASASRVVATDYDMRALEKLVNETPGELRGKLKTRKLDLNEKFPFDDASFDGVFNTGTIHLFPVEMVERIFGEVDRVLKRGGRFVIDFACEIKRETKDGDLINDGRKQYAMDEVRSLFEHCFPDYDLLFEVGELAPEWVGEQEKPHFFSCKFWVVRGEKRN